MIPIGPGKTILFNEDGKQAIEAFANLAHYVLVTFTDDKEDAAVIIPILHGDGVIAELRKHMRQYRVVKRPAKRFLRICTAHQKVINAGMYEPPRARSC